MGKNNEGSDIGNSRYSWIVRYKRAPKSQAIKLRMCYGRNVHMFVFTGAIMFMMERFEDNS